ncbi:hypothetical protein GCM10017559_64180 [Streptosporangium longisporum]|uniref:Uncharacterized protein n=1 Tax=Streptosporangium longisporum TaxID=46187 RepID=A0ABP6L0N1_9ACTN
MEGRPLSAFVPGLAAFLRDERRARDAERSFSCCDPGLTTYELAVPGGVVRNRNARVGRRPVPAAADARELRPGHGRFTTDEKEDVILLTLYPAAPAVGPAIYERSIHGLTTSFRYCLRYVRVL